MDQVCKILEQYLPGCLFGDELEHFLNQDHPFRFETIMKSPKDDHGEYTIDAGKYHLKPMTYHVLHTWVSQIVYHQRKNLLVESKYP